MKYKLVKYINGEQLDTFESNSLDEARAWHDREEFLENCAIRVFVNGEKLTYSMSNTLMASTNRRRRLPGFGRVDYGKKAKQHFNR